MPLAGIGKVRHMQSRNEDMRYALRMERLKFSAGGEDAAYSVELMDAEEQAILGVQAWMRRLGAGGQLDELLRPYYERDIAADLARYKSFLHPARNEMDSAVERDN